MFGGGQNTFGAAPAGGGFGTPNPTFGGGAGGGGFGAGAGGQTGGFGTPGTGFGGGGGFGTTGGATGGFGQTGFGSTPASGFGTQGSSLGGGAFGARSGTGGFGAPATGGMSGFGSTQPGSQSAFGARGGMFGGTTASTTFGSPGGTSTGFGNTQGSGFGGSSQLGTFSSPGGQMGFGNQPGSAFGAQGGGGMMGGAGGEAHNPANENEIKREDRPTDSITSVRFIPSADPSNQYFSVSSWDNSIRLFLLQPQGPPMAKTMATCPAPVFDTCFKSDGTTIFAGCADNTVQMWNLAAGMAQPQTIGRHDGPVKTAHWIPEMNILVTGSWDKTLRYWDLRQPNPAQVVQVRERVHAMAVKSNNMVVACGGQAVPVLLFDIMRSPQNCMREKLGSTATSATHPKLAIRALAISTDNQFFCMGGVEGRCLIQFIDENKSKSNFTFRCHKTEETKGAVTQKFYNPVNDIQFHPKSNVMATCGSDGSYCYWDIGERSRLHQGPATPAPALGATPPAKRCLFPGGDRPAPVLCSSFNAEGSVYAYAIGYDWNLGPAGNNAQAQVNAVVLHYVQPTELKKKSGR